MDTNTKNANQWIYSIFDTSYSTYYIEYLFVCCGLHIYIE